MTTERQISGWLVPDGGPVRTRDSQFPLFTFIPPFRVVGAHRRWLHLRDWKIDFWIRKAQPWRIRFFASRKWSPDSAIIERKFWRPDWWYRFGKSPRHFCRSDRRRPCCGCTWHHAGAPRWHSGEVHTITWTRERRNEGWDSA